MFVLLLCTNKSERTGNNKSKMTQILFPHCKLVIGLPVRATPNLEMRSNILSMSKKRRGEGTVHFRSSGEQIWKLIWNYKKMTK